MKEGAGARGKQVSQQREGTEGGGDYYLLGPHDLGSSGPGSWPIQVLGEVGGALGCGPFNLPLRDPGEAELSLATLGGNALRPLEKDQSPIGHLCRGCRPDASPLQTTTHKEETSTEKKVQTGWLALEISHVLYNLFVVATLHTAPWPPPLPEILRCSQSSLKACPDLLCPSPPTLCALLTCL